MVARAEASIRSAARDPAAPAWMQWGSLGISVAGLAIAIYLTVEHFTTPTLLACPDTGAINCLKVTTSPQSVFAGIPVAVLGLVFFTVMVLATVPPAWRIGHPAVTWGRLGFVAVGVLFVLYLLYAELFEVRSICLWCTAVHLLTLALFAVLAFGTASAPPATMPAKPATVTKPATKPKRWVIDGVISPTILPAQDAVTQPTDAASRPSAKPTPATTRRRPAGRRR